MRTNLGILAVFSLIILMIIPVHADVTSAVIDKANFTIDDKFTISGTVDDSERLFLVAAMKGPNEEKLNKNIRSDNDGSFSFIPINAELLFESKGTYTITVFTEKQVDRKSVV